MTSSVERVWDDAVRMGLRNQETIELARRHCLNMQFVPSGGRGMAEAETGLPIDMRQIRCPVALGSMSSNLPWIAADFYRDHCVGCTQRRPTGEVPNLATAVEETDAATAAAHADEQARLVRERADWERRVDERRSLGSSSGEAMAGVLRDIDMLDSDPIAPMSQEEREAARARVSTLADRAPGLFTADVVAAAVALVETAGRGDELLDALRRLARRRPEFAADTARAAVVALRAGRSTWAGPCVAELIGEVGVKAVDEEVCLSLVQLAGAPALNDFGRSRPNRANDPTGLQAVAGVAPEVVARVLQSMLPPPAAPRGLVLPASEPPPRPVRAHDRAAAAGAVRALAGTSPDLAASLVDVLVLDLALPPDDEYNDPALPAIERTLAALLVLDVGDVPASVDTAGRHGDRELRERLLRMLSFAADTIAPNPRWREPGDPTPDEARRAAVTDTLFAAAAARVGGDWGDDARFGGARLIETLAEHDPLAMLPRTPALLGAVLDLLDAERAPAPARLDVVSREPAAIRALEQMNRSSAITAAISRVLHAIESVAAADAAAVCAALVDLITDERDTDRGSDLLWWLLRTLGRIGRRHGDEPRVLRIVLPTLHSYLVAGDALLRGRAIDAWVEIASAHALPSSLVDLLPALTKDATIAVARAVARAAARLDWPEAERPGLLYHALQLLYGVDPSNHADAMKDAIYAATWLSRDADEPVRAAVEQVILEAAARLDGYDLRDALRSRWLPQTDRSPQMARLRLRQALDPQINDRWNAREDEELCALLACGPGLAGLTDAELTEVALALAPEDPLAVAEIAEVAWRAGRPGAAAAIMATFLAATPDQPAFASRRLLIDLVRAAADGDADAAARRDWQPAAARVAAAVATLTADHDSDVRRATAASATAGVEVRRLLAGDGDPTGRDPADAARARADAVAAAGDALADASPHATDTGGYLRALAAACDVAAHLLRADAAALDADRDGAAAHADAASRRAAVILDDLEARFAADDPLAAPLRARLAAVAGISPGAPAGPVLEDWVALSIPLPIVVGSRRRPGARGGTPAPAPVDGHASPTPVAVVLASLDGQLVTGPEVLRSGRVYDLGIEVQAGPWPDWADRLDAELLTHLTAAEITTPEFSWGRADHTGDGETYAKTGPLVLRFTLGPGQPAPPLLFRVTWRGHRDGERVTQTLDLTGHRELRLRPYDATRDRSTDYPIFDERLLGLYDALARAGYDADQLQAFCRLLTSICRAGLRMTWDRRYRRGTKVSERQFHDDLHDRLVADPELGGRVDRGSPLALGYLDVRHDGITAELKVERKTPVTRDTAPKYMGQPTQYAAADGARLSILTILDMSPKVLPIGTPENYLFTLEPRLHGLANPEAPSLVTVLIVNGNLPTPSSWSRRRLPKPGGTGEASEVS